MTLYAEITHPDYTKEVVDNIYATINTKGKTILYFFDSCISVIDLNEVVEVLIQIDPHGKPRTRGRKKKTNKKEETTDAN